MDNKKAKYIKVDKKNAEKIKKALIKNKFFNWKLSIIKEGNYIYFPILDVQLRNINKILNVSFTIITKKKFVEQIRNPSLRSIFKEDKDIIKSYDLLGNVAIINIRKNTITPKKILNKKAKDVAKILMKIHPNIETVVSKAGAISGIYRTRDFKYVAGKKSFVANYKENNCIFKFDVRKSFFSSRLSYERTRIMKQVKDNCNVAVMFAGVGPFSIEIAKAHPTSKVISIELNKEAYSAMCENIKLNNVNNVEPVLGDVKKVAKKYKDFADYIVMPLPKDSMNFLDEAFIVAKDKAIVSIYVFGKRDVVLGNTFKILQDHAKKHKYKVKIIFNRVVRPYSREEDEIVVDYKIIKNKI
ncbi:MAG: class I SAM-dependent methyltransferase [Candidatus Micrarchaeia archaeon]